MRLLSSIILNWNRERLLRRTVESYLATTKNANVELIILDNGSADGSSDYLIALREGHPEVRVIQLEENKGGEAYNLAIAEARGELIHLSENDQEFLPGWFEHVCQAFDAFPDLGQLSLHHDMPQDDEAWEPKPSRLRFATGKVLYEALHNVGTSSILRSEIFRNHGVMIKNIEAGAFKFPDDGALSGAVKQAGYWVAWSDRYHVRNLGHLVEEFEAEPAYYESNYASKPWLGVEGWQKRIDRQRHQPTPNRRSIVFPAAHCLPEKTVPPVGEKAARLWSMLDGWTAEVEVLDFLHGLVRLVKPRTALETGTWLGWSACSVGRAMQANGFGKLVSLEINPEAMAVARQNVLIHGLAEFVELRIESSLDYVPDTKVEFALFDSATDLREAEFRKFHPWLAPGAVVIFHDTAPHHQIVGEAVQRLSNEGLLRGVELPTPRGLFVGKVT